MNAAEHVFKHVGVGTPREIKNGIRIRVSAEGAADFKHLQAGSELAIRRFVGRIARAAAFNVCCSFERSTM